MLRTLYLLLTSALIAFATAAAATADDGPASPNGDKPQKVFRAGAYALDISPERLPVIVNGGFYEQIGTQVVDRLFSRALVLDDGNERIAIVVVDSVALTEDIVEQAAAMAFKACGIRADRMSISATHTHSAPSVLPCLGCPADPHYGEFLTRQIARSIQMAADKPRPAKIGWGVIQDFKHIHSRRWIKRLDRIGQDPFGEMSVRAMMHPGHQNPDYVAPSGPVDPDISMLSVQTPEGKPIALMANYCVHYYGSPLVSSDYFGQFVDRIKERIAPGQSEPEFVGIMSQGTNGDQMWLDYGRPPNDIGYKRFAAEVADRAYEGYKRIEYRSWVPIAMREESFDLCVRGPVTGARLAQSAKVMEQLKDRRPTTLEEIYAREQILSLEKPLRRVRLQAIRIGELGITTSPTESYGLTGLKIKAQSPLQPTINIGVANGEIGYIPPPEQYKFGGYNTWDTRYGCEPETEPKVVESLLRMLEQVSGKPRRPLTVPRGAYAEAVLASKPVAYYRMEDMNQPVARDSSGHGRIAAYEDLIAFYLEGPDSSAFSDKQTINRAAHFAGGRLRSGAERWVGPRYSAELWFWSGLPNDARDVLGHLFARETNAKAGDRLAISGKADTRGRLLFAGGGDTAAPHAGRTTIQPKTWNHLVLVRDRDKFEVYLNGGREPDFRGKASGTDVGEIFVGGRADNAGPFEGKIDEVSLYDRPLSADEVQAHFRAAAYPPVAKPAAAATESNATRPRVSNVSKHLSQKK